MSEPLPPRAVLIVDDDAATRETFGALLEVAGFEVSMAADGVEALQHLQQDQLPHAIVLDLHLPRMNGWVFCLEKQKDPRAAHVPVVIISGQTDPAAPAGF